MDDSETQQTALFLLKTAQTLSTSCPAASRYYMSTLSRHVGNPLMTQSFIKPSQYCKYCGSLWSHLNHKIRIQPLLPPNRHIKKLFKLEKEQPWKLNNQQRKKLKKYRETTNKIIYTCKVCQKTTPFVGLTKYSAKEEKVLISTPAPKKLKKGDINAGLFIKTPTEKKIQNKSGNDVQDNKCQNDISFQALSTPELIDPSNQNNTPQTIQKAHFTSEVIKKNVTPPITSSKKKKKGLLAQILNQEQEAKRQKKTLSSFLTSL